MIIYKKDTKGNIRYLNIEAIGDNIIQRSGILDTENEVEHIKKAKSKNIGKSNETTAEEQAILEVDSTITSKLKEGYFETIEAAEEKIVILPMLAKSYKDEVKKIDWSNCYVQPKLDGMRCLAHIKKDSNITLMSRDGRAIENINHIIKELSSYRENIILDGELYAHGLSFQENMKIIKKYRQNESEQVKHHVYDIVHPDFSFSQRYNILVEYINKYKPKHIELVPTYIINSKEELIAKHAEFLAAGYEGTMIRWGDEGYKANGRSSNLLKYKDFQDIDAVIIDITPAEQRPEWGVPTLEYNGKIFRAGLRYSHEDKKEFLTNKDKYIGKIANIKFFEYTDDGLPRFPIMVGIHEDR
jgi:ATP-dependent DNA ligase